MADLFARLSTMRDMFYISNQLFSWSLDNHFQLIYTNAPDPDFYYQMFLVSSCYEKTLQHFKTETSSIVVTDKTGIAWMIAAQFNDTYKIEAYHICGPFFPIETSDSYLYQLCSKLNISSTLVNDLTEKLKKIPSLPLRYSLKHAIMLHYCVTGESITPDEITVYNEKIDNYIDQNWAELNYHGTWETEQKLFQQIKDGNSSQINQLLSDFSAGNIGKICPDNPVRQVKDELIVFVTLCSRAIILGGASPEGGYSLADYYLQRIESTNSIAELQDMSLEFINAFIMRSKQAKNNQQFSPAICAAMEYIENHLGDKINLDEMAKEVNYSNYYLSNKFQKEVGESVNSYIKKRKIKCAQDMLARGNYTIAYVSDYFAFSSVSYFSSVFKSITGITPGDFLLKKQVSD